MAVPKRRLSRANVHARRSQWKAKAASLATCPACGAKHLQHTACPGCGQYGARRNAMRQVTEA